MKTTPPLGQIRIRSIKRNFAPKIASQATSWRVCIMHKSITSYANQSQLFQPLHSDAFCRDTFLSTFGLRVQQKGVAIFPWIKAQHDQNGQRDQSSLGWKANSHGSLCITVIVILKSASICS